MVPRILVIGGGFAGLWAVRALARAQVSITLLDRVNHHLFQPLLYQVATAGLAAPSIAAPLRHILRGQANVTVLLDEVRSIAPAERRVVTDRGALPYDYLILAAGASHAYFGHPEWEPVAPGLKTLDDALAIRARILLAFEHAEAESDPVRRQEWLRFAIVGAGPTGVEMAGTLAEIARHTLAREFRRSDPRQASILLLEAGPRVLSTFTPELSARAERQLEKLGVTVRLGQAVTEMGSDYIVAGGERIGTRTVVWAAGVEASPLARSLGVPLDRAGRVLVNEDLSVPGHPEIFVAGDLAGLQISGRPVPGVAPAAKQMGAHAAKNLLAELRGRQRRPFRYRDYGNLATIGRQAAVVEALGLRLSGAPAWWFWLTAHLFFLVGFRNRLVVLIDWAWSYLSFARTARIILGSERNSPPP